MGDPPIVVGSWIRLHEAFTVALHRILTAFEASLRTTSRNTTLDLAGNWVWLRIFGLAEAFTK